MIGFMVLPRSRMRRSRMSSAEKDRSVWQNAGEDFDPSDPADWWYYTDEHNCTHGPYETEAEATERMQLHGLEE